jgi:NAD-dependent dihydropyrimidine dehydrogenase PreA subunit
MDAYKELAGRVGVPESKYLPGIFAMLADETDARILLALPGMIPALSESLELPEELLERKLHEQYLKGVVFFSRKTSPPTYRMSKSVLHLHDTTVQWKEAPSEFLALWQEWVETECVDVLKGMREKRKGGKPGTRIISANIWIKPESQVMPFDSLKELVYNARSLAVMPCTCRIKAKKCDHLLEACIVLNNSADYNIERGTGRKIDAAEAMEIFRKCEEEGLVHLGAANAQDDPGPLLCNCCPCCCMGMPSLLQGQATNDPSRFRAEIDQDLCTGCGICQERCYFHAIAWTEAEGSACVVDAGKCIGCGLCPVKCPVGAIRMVEARPKDFVPETSKTNIYG